MSDYVLSCCSTADLSKEFFEKRDIGVVYFHFELNGEHYYDDCGVSITPEELFHRMDAGADTRTSQPSVGEYCDFWRKYLEQGKDIIHVCLSSGISGAYQSAQIAGNDMREEFPERTIKVIDSLGASSGYGLLIDAMADRRDEGYSLEELYRWTMENRLRVHHWFFSTDLKYYIRGGRVSRTAGFIGNLFNICPLLHVDEKGMLIPREKMRGKKAAMRRTLEKMVEFANEHRSYAGKCFISHSLCVNDAKTLAKMIEETFPNLDGKVEIYPIGATIGSHTGPGTIATFFWGDDRKDDKKD